MRRMIAIRYRVVKRLGSAAIQVASSMRPSAT